MGDGRLDDRHVLYDLTSAISILPIANGGIGTNTIMQGITAGNNRVVCTDVGGNRLVADAQITVSELRALNGADQGVGSPTPSVQTIHNRIVSLENHAGTQGNMLTYNKVHMPAPAAGQGGFFAKAKSDLSGYELTSIRQVPAAPLTNPQDYLLGGDGQWYLKTEVGGGGGTEWLDPGLFYNSNVVTITSNTSWTIPAGVKLLRITAVGGGGGGGHASNGLGQGGDAASGTATTISGVVSCPGAEGGGGWDNGYPDYGGAVGANPTLSDGSLITYETAVAGENGTVSGLTGRGGYCLPFQSARISGEARDATNPGCGGNADNSPVEGWASGGGAARPITFLLDVSARSSLSITIGQGGAGGSGGWEAGTGGRGANGAVRIWWV